MKVLDLRCVEGHGFEGWFGSEEDFLDQSARDAIACPMCGSLAISRLPSAPRISIGRSAAPAAAAGHSEGDSAGASPSTMAVASGPPATMQSAMQAQWLRAVRHVMQSTEDVGERFADEARKIHYGEVEERGIRGKASREDADALRAEGIEVVAFPVPDALKGPIQ